MSIRINKFLSAIGYCSRRQADNLIDAKRIKINDIFADKGSKVYKGDKIFADNKYIGKYEDLEEQEDVILALNKPRGIVCTTVDKDRAVNVVDYVNFRIRVYPVGRLDKESEGLILLTNNGELVNALMKSKNGHEKEYEVTVDKIIDENFLKKMERGVFLSELNVKTKPCKIKKIADKSFNIILTQGLNRQIRRMCKELGFSVQKLKRIRIDEIKLNELPYGKYRQLDNNEIKNLYKSIGIAKS